MDKLELYNLIKDKPNGNVQEVNFKKKYPEFYEELNTISFPEEFTFQQKLYHYFENDFNFSLGICPVCGKRNKFRRINEGGYNAHCSVRCSSIDDNVRTKLIETSKRKYGVEYPSLNLDVIEKKKKTCIEKYGVENPVKTEIVKNRMVSTNIKRYGVENFSQTNEFSKYHKKRVEYDGIWFDSKWEIIVYKFCKENNIDCIYQPDINFTYEYDGKIHYYQPDFKIDDKLYEVKGEHFFDGDLMINPFDRNQDGLYEAKHQCMLSNNVILLRENEIKHIDYFFDTLFGVSKYQLIQWVLCNDFPGTKKWQSNHPIWDCYVPNHKSPKDAWKDFECVEKAVNNIFKVLRDCIKEGKEKSFVNRHINEFSTIKIQGDKIIYSSKRLLELILNRFTVAKIAPKVTAISAFEVKNIIEQSGIDVSGGVYVPMAGFGGIVKGVELISKDIDVECYDINKILCDWYGWTEMDMLSEKVKTDKVVICCPPFGNTYEAWKGTPKEMSDKPFKEWYSLIKEYISAPDYIIIGPEVDMTGTGSNKGLDSSGIKRVGLFTKTSGVMRWTDDML